MPKKTHMPTAARQRPGPGLSTASTAFDDLCKDIAQQNELAHQRARKLRTVREQEQIRIRRDRDY
jgi:hypothetical protein